MCYFAIIIKKTKIKNQPNKNNIQAIAEIFNPKEELSRQRKQHLVHATFLLVLRWHNSQLIHTLLSSNKIINSKQKMYHSMLSQVCFIHTFLFAIEMNKNVSRYESSSGVVSFGVLMKFLDETKKKKNLVQIANKYLKMLSTKKTQYK